MPISVAVPAITETRPSPANSQDDLVLLVEDETALADLLANFLGRLNLNVLVAADGDTALGLFAEHHSRIVLAFVDCNLPDISGPEICERMRQRSPGLPLLLTSGRTQDALEARFSAGGLCGFLPKPYLPAEVLRRVTALLGKPA